MEKLQLLMPEGPEVFGGGQRAVYSLYDYPAYSQSNYILGGYTCQNYSNPTHSYV